MDNGKPIRETSAIDVPYSVRHFRYYASLIRTDEGTASVLDGNMMSLVLREPIGVVGQIVPWNFPFLMAAWKLAPALAAGNCVVFKPSSTTSLSMLVFTELIQDLLPAGVLNLVTGSGSKSGQYLLEHPDLCKLAFTGSTEIGKNIAKAAAEKLIPATLELGGKSANIIFDDCDWDMAVDGVQLGILFNQGQVCCAGSRVFVHENIYDKFVAALVDAFGKVNVGDPLDPATQMGAQVNKRQAEKILSYVEIAKQEGATVACGGDYYTENGCDKGSFVQPTLITNVTNDMRVAQNIETGRVWVNTYNQIPEGAPFGGYKQSGIGRENDKSILDAYSQTKNIMINLQETPSGFYPAK